MRTKFPALVLLAFCLAFSAIGCPCIRGAVNASPGIRWWLFSSFGASRICPEMVKRGAPLKLGAFGAVSVGRFFPEQCSVQVNEASQTIVMTLSGTGYATLPVARRVGFSCGVSVEYAPDFHLAEDDTIYVWGKFNRLMAPPDLRIIGVENPVIHLATQTPIGTVATAIGQGLVAGEIGRGFTVVRQDDGDDFAIGHIDPPAKPARQFKPGGGRVTVASDLTEIHSMSREYLGPFEVTRNQAVTLRTRTQGAEVTYFVVDRPSGDAWRRAYEAAQPLAAPFAPPFMQGTLGNGEGQNVFPLGPGQYFIVLENRSTPLLGGLGVGLGETSATVGYSIEVGDRQ
jgi:hypothetical protein